MTGGDAIVEALLANGVDTVFGLPGAQMYPLFDALERRGDRITTIGARHEQACGYMAFGYARSTGRPGVFAVVPGPGVLNTAAALCTGWGCNTPMLCITGQVPSQFLGRGRGHLHELPDQLGTLRTPGEMGRPDRTAGGRPRRHRGSLPADAVRAPGAGRGGDGVGHHGAERVGRPGQRRAGRPRPAPRTARDRGGGPAARGGEAADDHGGERRPARRCGGPGVGRTARRRPWPPSAAGAAWCRRTTRWASPPTPHPCCGRTRTCCSASARGWRCRPCAGPA